MIVSLIILLILLFALSSTLARVILACLLLYLVGKKLKLWGKK